MIRQAISCDICAAEKRQTNHWFVAYEQGGELRVSGWTSRHRLRPDSKHLCGQTCLHKLVDEFMAKSIAKRAKSNEETTEVEVEMPVMADTSLAVAAEIESSARLLPPLAQEPSKPVHRPLPEIVTMPSRTYPKEIPPLPADTLRYASRRWHAEAWEREREREMRAAANQPDTDARRRTSA